MLISPNVPLGQGEPMPSQYTKHNDGLRALDEKNSNPAAQVIHLDATFVNCPHFSEKLQRFFLSIHRSHWSYNGTGFALKLYLNCFPYIYFWVGYLFFVDFCLYIFIFKMLNVCFVRYDGAHL